MLNPLLNACSAASYMSWSLMVLLIILRMRSEPVSGAKVALRPPFNAAIFPARVWPKLFTRMLGRLTSTVSKNGSSMMESVRASTGL